MADFSLRAKGLAKTYGRQRICHDLSFEIAIGQSIAIAGPNGSGKSTIVRMLAGLVRPDRGIVEHLSNGLAVKSEHWYRHVGMVSPDLALYDELTGFENLGFTDAAMGIRGSRATHENLLDEMGLAGRGADLVRTYSSGMKQRLKIAASLLKAPRLLLFDEPTSMLDEDGHNRLWAAVAKRQFALVIATNDSSEAKRAQSTVTLEQVGA